MNSAHQLELQDIVPPYDQCTDIFFASITWGLINCVFKDNIHELIVSSESAYHLSLFIQTQRYRPVEIGPK